MARIHAGFSVGFPWVFRGFSGKMKRLLGVLGVSVVLPVVGGVQCRRIPLVCQNGNQTLRTCRDEGVFVFSAAARCSVEWSVVVSASSGLGIFLCQLI